MARERLRVLLVDGDLTFLEAASGRFFAQAPGLFTASSSRQALAHIEHASFDVIAVGSRLADGTGLELLTAIRETGNAATVVYFSEDRAIDSVIEAFQCGASDYVVRPCTPEELEERCRRATSGVRHFLRRCESKLHERRPAHSEMIGTSPAIAKLRRLMERVGPSEKAVLIEGESGTGKELVARAVLRASGRADGPFVTVNCAALPETLLESEFFGHEKGAFTGAATAKVGLFEAADGGTLFVDEIGELALSLQAKLLRVLEDGSIRRVGSVKERTVDVRIIAATNRDLAAASAAGRFREDLYYRINVMFLKVPPLREREGDIPRLTEAFLGDGWTLETSARYAVEHYNWPGNVRQLKNSIERAKVLADSTVIHLCDLPAEVASIGERARQSAVGDSDDIETLEREHVLNVLARENGNKSHAAKALGIHRRTLYRMLERWSAVDECDVGNPAPSTRPA